MKEYQIQRGEETDYDQLAIIWESSVKATHHFLKTEDLEYFRQIVPSYFPHVELYVLRSEEEIVAFMGISGENLEMLFVSGEARGHGYGKRLLEYALNNLNVTKVDVNEQNTQAVGFYKRFGFKVIGRSERDSTGKGYPILHLMFDKFPELHTERLELVEITQSHLVDFYEIFKDERATKYYNIIPFKKEEEAQKYIDWFQSRYKEGLGIRWGIKLKGRTGIIGTAGFNNYQKDHRANLGYDLHPDYWNKGYITETLVEILNFGFETLGINRVEAEVMHGNIASERVLEKLGFTKEGVLRDWMYWNNTHYDMTMYCLLKNDRDKITLS